MASLNDICLNLVQALIDRDETPTHDPSQTEVIASANCCDEAFVAGVLAKMAPGASPRMFHFWLVALTNETLVYEMSYYLHKIGPAFIPLIDSQVDEFLQEQLRVLSGDYTGGKVSMYSVLRSICKRLECWEWPLRGDFGPLLARLKNLRKKDLAYIGLNRCCYINVDALKTFIDGLVQTDLQAAMHCLKPDENGHFLIVDNPSFMGKQYALHKATLKLGGFDLTDTRTHLIASKQFNGVRKAHEARLKKNQANRTSAQLCKDAEPYQGRLAMAIWTPEGEEVLDPYDGTQVPTVSWDDLQQIQALVFNAPELTWDNIESCLLDDEPLPMSQLHNRLDAMPSLHPVATTITENMLVSVLHDDPLTPPARLPQGRGEGGWRESPAWLCCASVNN